MRAIVFGIKLKVLLRQKPIPLCLICTIKPQTTALDFTTLHPGDESLSGSHFK